MRKLTVVCLADAIAQDVPTSVAVTLWLRFSWRSGTLITCSTFTIALIVTIIVSFVVFIYGIELVSDWPVG
jgi:hypothetical protein